MLQIEEEYIQSMCEDIIRFKPDLVFTEKGVSGKEGIGVDGDMRVLHMSDSWPSFCSTTKTWLSTT